MASIILKSGTTLLDYAISTLPDPIQISANTTNTATASRAVIQIVVSNPNSTQPVYVKNLRVTLPMGISSANMLSADNSPNASCSQTGPGDTINEWATNIEGDVVNFSAGDATNVMTTSGLLITLDGFDVSTIEGAFEINIKEYAALSEDAAASQHATAIYVLGKFAPQLFLTDFWADHPQVGWGGAVTLNWHCTHGASATVTFSNQPGVTVTGGTMATVHPTDNTVTVTVATGGSSLTVNNLTSTTSFLLAVTETGGSQSETLYASVTVTVHGNQNYVPIGTIALWSCTNNRTSLPPGWAICNGQNGTPNLLDRFIVAAGSSSYPVDGAGDGDLHTHIISIPTRTFTTNSAGSHSHHFPSYWYDNKVSSGNRTTIIDRHAKPIKDATTTSAGDHTHTVSVSYSPFNAAGAWVDSNTNSVLRPKWYALYYIMRIS